MFHVCFKTLLINLNHDVTKILSINKIVYKCITLQLYRGPWFSDSRTSQLHAQIFSHNPLLLSRSSPKCPRSAGEHLWFIWVDQDIDSSACQNQGNLLHTIILHYTFGSNIILIIISRKTMSKIEIIVKLWFTSQNEMLRLQPGFHGLDHIIFSRSLHTQKQVMFIILYRYDFRKRVADVLNLNISRVSILPGSPSARPDGKCQEVNFLVSGRCQAWDLTMANSWVQW